MRLKPLFVTSPGTDVGKTLVMTTLCWQLTQQGKKVTALKPVISGFNVKDQNSDSALILKSCGLTPTPGMMETISPWRFVEPLSPNLAAAKEGRTINVNEVVAFCRDHATLETDALLVEGAGGVMAPLSDHATALDWIAELGWPVLLVTGSYLGALSHTLTALEVLRVRKLPIQALVVNESKNSPVSLADTVGTLEKFAGADIPVVKLPRIAVKEEPWKQMPLISWICHDPKI